MHIKYIDLSTYIATGHNSFSYQKLIRMLYSMFAFSQSGPHDSM